MILLDYFLFQIFRCLMSRGYDVSTDSLIHLAILEDSFSPAICSVVANFSGQRNHFFLLDLNKIEFLV